MSYESTVLARSPSLYVPFTETSGTSFADLTGNGHDGALISHVTPGGDDGPILGQKAAVCEIVGTSYGQWAEVDFGSPASLPTGANFTYEMWLRFPVNAAFGNPRMLFRLRGLFGGFFVWRIYQGVDDATMFVDLLNDPAGHDAGSNVAVRAVNCWHHYAGTLSGDIWSVYIDGVLQFTDTSSSWSSTFTPNSCLIYNTDEDTLHPFSLNHLAVYPVALTADEVAANYAAATPRQDADCFPQWVRLGHSSGQGYWQSRGDVTEEWAGGVKQLALPLATLTTTPAALVGRDPATLLPAYCPMPTLNAPIDPVPVPPVLPPPADACVRARCGAAVALQTKLVQDYGQWRQWINAAVDLAAGGLFAAVVDALLPILVAAEVAAWVLQVFKLVAPILSTTSLGLLPGLIPALSGRQIDGLVQRFFCQLQCASGTVTLSVSNLQAVSAGILADTATFPSDLQRELLGELVYYEPLQNWQAAMTNAAPSALCDGLTCP